MVTFGNEPLYASERAEPFASLTGLSTRRGECENRAKPHIRKYWFNNLWIATVGNRQGIGRTPQEAFYLLKGVK